jgi:V-type H+-transporting ATPase subunit C
LIGAAFSLLYLWRGFAPKQSSKDHRKKMEGEGKKFWLVSAPKTREDTFNTLNKKAADELDLSVNYKFQVPDLKVGTLDSLMALSDELNKVDTYVEIATRKIATQLFDLLDTKDKYEALSVNNNTLETYLTFFKWDEAKYPTSQALKSLVEMIQSQVAKLDEELKQKASEYNTLTHALTAEERKAGGNLLTKDLSDVIKPTDIVETEYLETLFVAVPKFVSKEWLISYEKLVPDYILPRSTEMVAEDIDYGLWRVILFKRIAEDFRTAAREKKFTVREYKVDSNKAAKTDKKKMAAEQDKLKKALIRWCKTNFSEAFVGWTHLKAVRVFVESVLRYGLPTNFQAILLLPKKNKTTKLRKILAELYGHLSSKSVFSGPGGDDDDNESFYPYVFLTVNLDYRGTSG